MRVIRVLFVDDEPLLLRGIERPLRRLRPDWQVTYTTSAVAALALLEREPVDVIVSDVGMPQMDGLVFLRTARHRFPQVARLVLSGEARSTDRVRAVLDIHQWIAKPCPVRDLVEVIERTFLPRGAIEDAELLATLCGIACLPSRLAFYRAAVRAIEQAAPLAELVTLLESDIGMTAKVIQLVNGAFFGTAQRITSVAQAVRTLGVEHVRAVLAAADVAYHPEVDELTERGRFVATLARTFATDHHDDVYLAGLLYDVAALASPPSLRPRLATMLESRIAALLLATWGLPPEVVAAVAFHQDPSGAPDPREHRLCCVALATALATELRAPATLPGIVDARAAALGLSATSCRARADALAAACQEPGISSTMPSMTFLPRSTR